jgi:membrane protease YdiL (CAAX protease family)
MPSAASQPQRPPTQAASANANGLIGAVLSAFRELLTREGILLWSVVLLLVASGPKAIPLFAPWFRPWLQSSDPLVANWRLQMFSFASGAVLLLAIPLAIIHFGFKQRPRDFGLGLGDRRLGLRFLLIGLIVVIPGAWLASSQPAMQAEYPLLYQGMTSSQIAARFNLGQFALFEILYASFFLTCEFTYRGYMLFGLEPRFGRYAIFIQMLPYVVWHLAKPVPELIGTPILGFVLGAIALRVRSLWYIMLVHWALNIFMDTFILVHRGVIRLPW